MHDRIHRQIAAARAACGGTEMRPTPSEAYRKLANHFVRYRVRAGVAMGRPVEVALDVDAMPKYVRQRLHILSSFLATLAGSLRDCEFEVYLGDGFNTWSAATGWPVFAFSKHAERDPAVLLLPDPFSLRDIDSFRSEVGEGNRRFPWEDKQSVAVWRGSTTGDHFSTARPFRNPRLRLVEVARDHPAIADARITGFHPVVDEPLRQMIRDLGYLAERMPLAEHMRWKYLLLVDGFTSPWPRFTWGMFANSVLMKQRSGLIGWFDDAVEEDVHYVGIAPDFSDLVERVEAARADDARMRRIAETAQAFAATHLSLDAMRDYARQMINAYAEAFGPSPAGPRD